MMFKKFAAFVIFACLVCSCGKSKTSSNFASDNELFYKKKYHKKDRYIPINNVMFSDLESNEVAEKSLQHYNDQYNFYNQIQSKNDEYFKFLIANIDGSDPKKVETLPIRNMPYMDHMFRVSGTSYNDDKALYIKYLFFVNRAVFDKKTNAEFEDKIDTVYNPNQQLNQAEKESPHSNPNGEDTF